MIAEKDVEYASQTLPNIQGYVIVHKTTGQRWGSCFDTTGGAKTSWYGAFVRRTGNPPSEMKHLKGLKFDEQDEYIIKPLIIWEQ